MNLDASGLRNFRDFLQLYNQMTERCFYKCIEHTNSRQLSPGEIECTEKRQNDMMARRIKEAEQMAESSNQTVTVSST